MGEDNKHILKIFVSHQDLNKFPGLRDACRILEEEKNRINHEGLQRDLIEVRLEDYQFWRNLSNPNNSTYQSADSLKDIASNAHAVFTLVEGDISPRIKKWYTGQIRKIRKEPDNRRVHLPVFWDTSNPESAANCESFYKRNDSDLVFRFNSLDEFRTHAASELKQLTDRWATLISRKQPVPTLASNSLRRRVRWLISGLVFALLCLAAYLLWPRIQSLCVKDNAKEPKTVIEQPQADSTQICEPVIVPVTPEPSEPSHQGKAGTFSSKEDKTIEDSTYDIKGINNPLRGYIVGSIKAINPSITSPSIGLKERWAIMVEQDLSVIEIPKIIESDEYMVDIEYSVAVIDNQTGKRVFENSFSTRGRSSASLEDAKKHSRQLAAQEIAEQIKSFIQ